MGGGGPRTEQEDLAFDPPLSGHILTKAGPSWASSQSREWNISLKAGRIREYPAFAQIKGENAHRNVFEASKVLICYFLLIIFLWGGGNGTFWLYSCCSSSRAKPPRRRSGISRMYHLQHSPSPCKSLVPYTSPSINYVSICLCSLPWCCPEMLRATIPLSATGAVGRKDTKHARKRRGPWRWRLKGALEDNTPERDDSCRGRDFS